jgi:hypothetical protein
MSKPRVEYTYDISFTETEKVTADWLDAHGYFGNFFQVATFAEGPEEDGVSEYRYTLTEPQAWEFAESTRKPDDSGDYDESFLACNGCRSLGDKILSLLDSIV